MSFVLSHEVVADQRSALAYTALVLHGMLGSGQNFRGLMRSLIKRRPDVAFVLVDLRCHGGSSGAPAPHTLETCAMDLETLSGHLRRTRPELPPVSSLIGHSFGGKVALRASSIQNPSRLGQVFVLDSDPGLPDPTKDNEVQRIIRVVRAVPMPASTRAEAVQALLDRGLSSELANWMTTNLRRDGQHYHWVFDLGAIEELLADYVQQDLWPYLIQGRRSPEFHLVVAEHSDRVSAAVRLKAQALPTESQCHYHVIPNAGHWLHVDNPRGVLELLEKLLA